MLVEFAKRCGVLLCTSLLLATEPLPTDLDGRPIDPLSANGARVRVLAFLRLQCPISNRYVPELNRLRSKFNRQSVDFWAVYEDRGETATAITQHQAEFRLAWPMLRDPSHVLLSRSRATVTPEVAVFRDGKLIYHGRIDDRVNGFGATRPEASQHDLADAISAALEGKGVQSSYAPATGCVIADVL